MNTLNDAFDAGPDALLRRVTACVAACEGIPTEWLEAAINDPHGPEAGYLAALKVSARFGGVPA